MKDVYVTRFNNLTYNENNNWKLNNNEINTCIYGSPIKISQSLLPDSEIIVLEMNNSTNKIEGFGLIKNNIVYSNKKKYKIYSDNNYNRFIYKSNYHIKRSDLDEFEIKILNNLEKLLFHSKLHCKRGQGIQSLPKHIKKIRIFDYTYFINSIINLRFNK